MQPRDRIIKSWRIKKTWGSNKQKRDDKEFKASAVKMIIEKGITVSEISKSLVVSEPAVGAGLRVRMQPKYALEKNRIWFF